MGFCDAGQATRERTGSGTVRLASVVDGARAEPSCRRYQRHEEGREDQEVINHASHGRREQR